jgi:hypothetical protein
MLNFATLKEKKCSNIKLTNLLDLFKESLRGSLKILLKTKFNEKFIDSILLSAEVHFRMAININIL